jgi:hypothetical protein
MWLVPMARSILLRPFKLIKACFMFPPGLAILLG